MDGTKSYVLAEAAELTGLSVPALRKRIARKTLNGFRSNEDGLWRVWLGPGDIPATVAAASDWTSSGRPLDVSTPRPVDGDGTQGALEAEIRVLREALSREQELGDRARAGEAEARERAGRAEGARDAEAAARERAEAEVTRLRAELDTRKAGGVLARRLKGLLRRGP